MPPVNRWLSAMLAGALLMAPVQALAQNQPEKVRLQIKGRAGEVRRVALRIINHISAGAAERRSDVRLTIEEKVNSVSPDGRMTLTQTMRRIQQVAVEQDGTIVEFDSDDPADLKKLRANLAAADLLKTLGKPFVYEQEPSGELRTLDKSPADPLFEQMVTQANMLFPSQPVGSLDNWEMGTVTRPASGLGGLVVSTTGVLLHVRVEKGERVAYVGMSGKATLRPDRESGVTATLKSFEEGGVIVLSLDRGRVLQMMSQTSAELTIVESGRTQTLVIKGEITLEALQ